MSRHTMPSLSILVLGTLLVTETAGWVTSRAQISWRRRALHSSPQTWRAGSASPTYARQWRHARTRHHPVAMAVGGEETSDDIPTSEREAQAVSTQRICVLGGGFGGLYTALRLEKLPWGDRKPEITLVDKRDKFTFLPLLYEFAVGNADLDEVAPTFQELLADTDVSFVQACASGVDLERKEVHLAGSIADDLDGYVVSDKADETRMLKYDKLVIAVGAEPASGIDKVPGASKYAVPFYNIEDSYRVKKAIRELKVRMRSDSIVRVVVVGGSYLGVELACNMATELRRREPQRVEITLVTKSEVLAMAAPSTQEAGKRQLQESGVRILTGMGVAEVKDGGVVVFRDGEASAAVEDIESDLLLWTAGSQPSLLLDSLEVPKDGRGRVEVNSQLQVMVSETYRGGDNEMPVPSTVEADYAADVFCMGDAATVQGMDLRSTAQVAIQQSDYVAYNIWAQKTRRKPLEFRYVDLGELMNLGGLNGSLSALSGRIRLDGKAAGLARRAIYAVRMPTNPQRVRAAVSAAAGTAFSVTNAILDTTADLLDCIK